MTYIANFCIQIVKIYSLITLVKIGWLHWLNLVDLIIIIEFTNIDCVPYLTISSNRVFFSVIISFFLFGDEKE